MGGAGTAFIFGIQVNVFAAVTGALIGVLGLLYNVWARERHLRIEQARYLLEVASRVDKVQKDLNKHCEDDAARHQK